MGRVYPLQPHWPGSPEEWEAQREREQRDELDRLAPDPSRPDTGAPQELRARSFEAWCKDSRIDRDYLSRNYHVLRRRYEARPNEPINMPDPPVRPYDRYGELED